MLSRADTQVGGGRERHVIKDLLLRERFNGGCNQVTGASWEVNSLSVIIVDVREYPNSNTVQRDNQKWEGFYHYQKF